MEMPPEKAIYDNAPVEPLETESRYDFKKYDHIPAFIVIASER